MSFSSLSRFLGGIFFISIIVLTPLSGTLADSNTITTAQVQQSLDYIWSNQNSDGGLEEGSTPSLAAWAAIAFVSAGYNPDSVKQSATSLSLLDYIKDNACVSDTLTDIEMTVISLNASNIPLTDIKNCNLELKFNNKMNDILSSDDFSENNPKFLMASIFGVLAYKSYGYTIPNTLINYIKKQQVNGSWGTYYAETWIDPAAEATYHPDDGMTAEAIMALMAGGVLNSDESITSSLAYLKSKQGNNGGIWTDTNYPSSSTMYNSYVIQAIYSADGDPLNSNWLFSDNNNSILDDTARYRGEDGSYVFDLGEYGGFNPVWMTATALSALLGYTLPISQIRPLLSFVPQRNTNFSIDNTNSDEAPNETNNDSGVNNPINIENNDDKATIPIIIGNNQPAPIQLITNISTRKSTTDQPFPDPNNGLDHVRHSTAELNNNDDSNNDIKNKSREGKVLGSEDNNIKQNNSNDSWIYILIGLSGGFIGLFLYRWNASR